MPRFALAPAEPSMILEQDDETRIGERMGKTFDAVLCGSCIPMCHGDSG
jgi:hypothetical protein